MYSLAYVVVFSLVASFGFLVGDAFIFRQNPFRGPLQLHVSEDSVDHSDRRLRSFKHQSFQEIAVVGFASNAARFSDDFIFRDIFERHLTKRIRCVTDDEKFARKRLVTPKTVYSGLIDHIEFVQAPNDDIEALKTSLSGADALVAFNVSQAALPAYAAMCRDLKLRRAVLGVSVEGSESDVSLTNATAAALFGDVCFTLIKYGRVEKLGEAKQPYRIVRGDQPVPVREQADLATGDLFRALSESINLPKAFNGVYGMGPGGAFEQHVLVIMRAQGFSQGEQAGVLLGDTMENAQKLYEEHMLKQQVEQRLKEEKAALKSSTSSETVSTFQAPGV